MNVKKKIVRPYNRQNYQENRAAFQARAKQPPVGNYRVDAKGNPILPKNSPSYEKVDLGQDHNYQRNDSNHSNFQSPPNFRANEYNYSRSIMEKRSNQPRRPQPTFPLDSQFNYPKRTRQVNRSQHQRNTYQTNKYTQHPGYHRPKSRPHNQQKPREDTLPKNRIQLLGVFVALLFIYLYNFWQLMPMQRVNNISVSGNHYAQGANIIDASRISPLDRVDTVLTQSPLIEKKVLEEIPIVEDISIQRNSWKELELKVTEFDIVALMDVNGIKRPVMANGELIMDDIINSDNNSLSNNLPELVNFSQKGKVVELTNNALRTISPDLLKEMKKITLSDDPAKPNTIIVEMKDGNKIQAIINTFSDKMAYYKQILDQLAGQTGVINLEVGAYFTPDSNANSLNLNNN